MRESEKELIYNNILFAQEWKIICSILIAENQL